MDLNNCWVEGCSETECKTCREAGFCLKAFKLNYLFDQACIPLNNRRHIILRVDSDGSDRAAFKQLADIEKNAVSFVKSGQNLYLYSYNCGVGKTSWSFRIGSSYLYNIWPLCDLKCKVLFVSVSRFFIELKANISQESSYAKHIQDNVLDADLVIWDDIGTKTITAFEAEHLLSIIDARINMNKSNIYTSNVKCSDLETVLGSRLTSRIINNSTVIELVGKDKRGVKS